MSRPLWQVIHCPRAPPTLLSCLTKRGEDCIALYCNLLYHRPTCLTKRGEDCIARLGGHCCPPITLLPPHPPTNYNTLLLLLMIYFKPGISYLKLYKGTLLLLLFCICCISVAGLVLPVSNHPKSPIAPTLSHLLHLTFTGTKVAIVAACIEIMQQEAVHLV